MTSHLILEIDDICKEFGFDHWCISCGPYGYSLEVYHKQRSYHVTFTKQMLQTVNADALILALQKAKKKFEMN